MTYSAAEADNSNNLIQKCMAFQLMLQRSLHVRSCFSLRGPIELNKLTERWRLNTKFGEYMAGLKAHIRLMQMFAATITVYCIIIGCDV